MIKSKRFVKILLVAVSLSSMLLGGCSMNSANYVGNEPNYSDRAPRKLGRGMSNILTAPLEIPNQAVDLAAENDEPAEQFAGYVGGVFVGFAYAGGRIVSGMYDIVTSPFGGPATPTMDPDTIHSDFFEKVDERTDSFSDVWNLGAD
ncbi:exosortase system-associated protein, TIGR04073 family [Desulfovibrio sp. JC010]|uniref:exosortase system-associated protein, TIGR04073 family n=1 Tax=Desulfovibrio sp. JC010 TaxID=2593641 RepID=UPI0013D49F4F|nr:exosortase system-associated protein, TIGR04073 family [Desulfovibrio sp. JC010]NDV28836.1 exosortase system-associated protein, TIGR04073 family [Desulfovibrio sp. JC010]